ncbi:hypothetical protein WJX77_001717 [Trebouxia sp. C0004]
MLYGSAGIPFQGDPMTVDESPFNEPQLSMVGHLGGSRSVKAEWMQQNRKLQSQLHAANLTEIAARRSISQLKRDMCAAKQHASDGAWGISVMQQLAEQHAAELKEFFGDLQKRVEDADVLQQLSLTLKTQLSAETERASSSEARVVTLDLHLAETCAEVDNLAAQVAQLEEQQEFQAHLIMRQASEDDTQSQLAATQQQLSDEQQAHAAAAPSAAVLQVNLQEAQQAASAFLSQLKLVEEGLAAQKQCREDANQKAASLQTRLQEVKGELAAEQQACITARETLTSLQTERAAAQESAASLQAKLAAPEEALAAEKFAHGSAVTSLKADLGVAEQGVSCLQSQLKALESQLAAGKQALEAVIQSVARFPSPLKAVQQELADKTANWSGEKQGEQAGAEAVAGLGHHVAASGHQVEEAAQRCPSPQEGLRSSWSKTHESRDSQPDADVASQLTPRKG